MADGSYGFQQGGGPRFHHLSQNNHPQTRLNRNGSPISFARPHHEIPSPSHSPRPQSPGHQQYAMFGQGHSQGHNMMNGPSNQRYMQMGMAHKYQHAQQSQQHHSQSSQQQLGSQGQHAHHHMQHDHGHMGSSQGIGHGHSYSASGLSGMQHYSHNQNGASGQSNAKETSAHWQLQQQLAAEARQANSNSHYYARQYASQNKASITPQPPPATTAEGEQEPNRATFSDTASISPRQEWRKLDIGGQGLRALTKSFFSFDFLETVFLNNNKLSKLPPAIGSLRFLTHLDLSNNNLSDLPPEIGMLSRLRKLYVVDNNLHTLPYEMGALYQLEVLAIEGNPLSEEIKSEIMQNGVKSLIIWLRENAPATVPPPQRDWIQPLDRDEAKDLEQLRVLDYNTLCEKYATRQKYGYTPSQALSWEYRKELILSEIRSYEADFVCQQEVDGTSFEEFFRPSLAYNHYKGIFWPKTRAKTMAEKDAKLVDGCATYYKANKYVLLDKQFIDFANIAINRPDMKGEHDVFNRVMTRDYIAVVAFFENLQTGSRIIVANTHFFWDTQYEDVKIVQAAILVDQLSKLSEKYARWPPCVDKAMPKSVTDDDEPKEEIKLAPSQKYNSGLQIPLLICGDFNSTEGSGVHDLLSTSYLPPNHKDLINRRYGNFTRDGITHPFSLKSSYAEVGELPFTNYTAEFVGVLDYIWYATNTLQVTQLLGEVDKTYLQRVPGFPNWNFPSDHIALVADFAIKGSKKKREDTPSNAGNGEPSGSGGRR